MGWKVALGTLCLALGSAAAVGYFAASSETSQKLQIRIVSPEMNSTGAIPRAPFEKVDVVVELRNNGREPVNTLTIQTGCRCQLKSPFPESLQPGQAIEVTLEFRAPPVGVARRDIVIGTETDTGTAPLVTSSVLLQADVPTPSWLEPPRGVSWTFVAGEPSAREVVWEAIEEVGTLPWIRNVRIEPDDALPTSFSFKERPWGEDGRHCLRRYQLKGTAPNEASKARTGEVHFESADPQHTPAPLAIQWDVLTPLVAFPPTVDLRAQNSPNAGSARVTIFNRMGERPQVIPQFDETRLEVVPVETDSTDRLLFEIRLRQPPEESFETELAFAPAHGDPLRVAVRASND